MPGVTTAFQTGTHASRPANGAGCILYSCTTHGLVYLDNGSSWSTYATLGGGAPAAHAASHEDGGSDEIDVTGLVGAGGGGSSAFVGAKAFHTAVQSIPNNAVTPLDFNSEEFDTNGFHDTGTNPSRFTVPTGQGGYYLLQGGSSGPACQQAGSEVFFRKNGATIIRSAAQGDGTNGWVTLSALVSLVATDYVELCIYQNQGGAQNAGNAAGADNQSWMSVALLGT